MRLSHTGCICVPALPFMMPSLAANPAASRVLKMSVHGPAHLTRPPCALAAGWHLQARRQLLPGLPGPICGLTGAGTGKLLAATERPVGQFLGSASEPSEQLQPGVLQRYLTAKESAAPPVLLPSLHSAPHLAGHVAAEPALPPPPASEGLIDLTRDHHNPFLTAPAAAAGDGPPIPAMFLLRPAHMPLAQGLPLLPGGSPPRQQAALGATVGSSHSAVPPAAAPAAAADGGHASLLWLGRDACGSPTSPLASPREHMVPLSCAGDLLQVGLGLLAVAMGTATKETLSIKQQHTPWCVACPVPVQPRFRPACAPPASLNAGVRRRCCAGQQQGTSLAGPVPAGAGRPAALGLTATGPA